MERVGAWLGQALESKKGNLLGVSKTGKWRVGEFVDEWAGWLGTLA